MRMYNHVFPFQNKEMIEGKLAKDNDFNILSEVKPPTKWIDFTPKMDLNNFEKIYLCAGKEHILQIKCVCEGQPIEAQLG